MDLRLRRSQIPIVVSAEPVATTYSEAGLNERALMASVWPLEACVAEAVVVEFRVSSICMVRSSDTVPIKDPCSGWYCTSFTMAE